ncbi:GtrA family protein [Cryobacterium adonitolivorans]|uniref:GtrA family protein n=1 Tax=Cryobacterium adonitolivorans TaxID=1259189 RepID=A0A4R8WBG3_9MICO|nr:GtrA family protein [Cryobacterium adonitolivorans]TFC05479.1 GtrA family protein [Cryobacterium adonitolivorans]
MQLAKFGMVGLVGFAVDITVFNLLRATVFSPEALTSGPIWAKVVSTILAILANWVGNRYWTFSKDRRSQTLREGLEFFAVSLVGMGIGLACLAVSHYVLGYTSVIADNISSNVIGLLLGAVFRFTLYRYWVFSPSRRGETPVAAGTGATRTAPTRTVPTSTVPTNTGALRLQARAESEFVTER